MKPYSYALFPTLLFLPAASFASTELTTSVAPLTGIEQGKIKAGGGFDLSYGENQKLTLNISPTAEYFVTDRLSLGGTFSLAIPFGTGLSYYSIGPSATFYFWKQERLAASFSESVAYARLSGVGYPPVSTGALISTTKLGVEYFFTPSVSFGPAFQWRHAFTDVGDSLLVPSQNTYSVVGQFSLYF